VNSLANVERFKPKYIFSFEVLLLFGVSFFIWMAFKIVLNDTSKGRVSDCSRYLFSALNAGIFFVIYKLCEAASAESMIARLNRNWYRHNFIAKRTCNLVFYRFGKVVRRIFTLLFLLVFLFFFRLLLLFFLPILLCLLHFLLFLFLFYSTVIFQSRSQFNFKSNSFIDGYLTCS
jgi:hypothetical protein